MSREPQVAPLVTIGIPVYNGEGFLEAALQSALTQDYPNLELIVADNASTDRTIEVAEQAAHGDSRVRIIRSEANRGACWNYNRLVQYAHGEYFQWLAADDVLLPGAIRRKADVLTTSPDVTSVHGDALFVEPDGRLVLNSCSLAAPEQWPREPGERTAAVLDAMFRDGRTAMVYVFGLHRTSTLRRIRPLGNYYAADWTLALCIAMAGELVRIPEPLVRFAVHASSSSSYSNAFDAERQQAFYDPAIRDRTRVWLQYRRRYAEIPWSVLSSGLPPRARLQGLNTLARLEGSAIRRAIARRARLPAGT